ncbi:MAG: hypothetical protein II622_04895 [Thermoguttaceae bacterium]|nr:hypothetical protein [Thermoguttaceae bacterium]
MNSKEFLQEMARYSDDELTEFLALWNDSIMREVFPGASSIPIGSRTLAWEVLQEVKEKLADWEWTGEFELDEQALELREHIIKHSVVQDEKRFRKNMDFFATLAHVINENERGNIYSPKTTITELTATFAWEGLRRFVANERITNLPYEVGQSEIQWGKMRSTESC